MTPARSLVVLRLLANACHSQQTLQLRVDALRLHTFLLLPMGGQGQLLQVGVQGCAGSLAD